MKVGPDKTGPSTFHDYKLRRTNMVEVTVTQRDRDALEAVDDALGFLTDPERKILLEAFARHRASTAPDAEPVATYRHVKRGTTYAVIGEAELQVATWNLRDGSKMVVYRGEDGQLWVREYGEFHDGRFEYVEDTHPAEPVAYLYERDAEPAVLDCTTHICRAGEHRTYLPPAEPVAQAVVDASDAARYRWLRDYSCPPHNFYIAVPDEFGGVRYKPDEVDAYIDAALAAMGERS